MLRQIRMNKWRADADEATIDATIQALNDAFEAIPQIKGSFKGKNLGIAEPATAAASYDYVIVHDFESVEDWKAYRADEQHQKVVREQLIPLIDQTAIIHCDYEG